MLVPHRLLRSQFLPRLTAAPWLEASRYAVPNPTYRRAYPSNRSSMEGGNNRHP